MLTLLSLSLISSPAIAEINPPDTTIPNALIADIPPEGFRSIEAVIPGIIPLDIPIEDQNIGGSVFGLDLTGMVLDASIADVAIIPQDGALEFSITLAASLNDAFNPFGLDYTFFGSSSCTAYIDPFEIRASSKIFLNVLDMDGDGINDLDAYFSDFDFDYSDFDGQDINVEGCTLGDIEDVLNYINWSLFDVIIGAIGPGLESGIEDSLPDLELAIEEAFAQATIQETIDLSGATLELNIEPADLIIKPEGLRFLLDASATTESAADCISRFDPLGSKATPSELSPIGDLPSGISDITLAALVDDDFINQALYSVWRSGLLCFTVDEETFALDTSMLGLLTGGAYDDLFPEPQPMIIKTEPRTPLTSNVNTSADLAVDVNDLDLSFFVEVDGRTTRLLSVGLKTDVGVDILLDNNTGALSVALDLDTNRIVPTASYNEFRPEANGEIEASFTGQLDTILGLVDLESMLGDLSFALPSLNGLGITAIDFAGAGENAEDLGVFISVGEVPYESTGCTDTGGCGEGGCSTNGRPNSRLGLLGFVLLFGLLRRRTS